MTDDFKIQMHKQCGVFGVHCWCCNPYHGKDKKKMNKTARKMLKELDRKSQLLEEGN